MLFDDNNFDIGFLKLSGLQSNNEDILYSKEGFLRGNMFGNLYDKYKNYEPKQIMPKSDKEACLLNIMQYLFAINDLNLYLDIHNDDKKVIELFNKYNHEYEKALKIYEEKYGPLCITKTYDNEFKWVSNWPWENEEVKYV